MPISRPSWRNPLSDQEICRCVLCRLFSRDAATCHLTLSYGDNLCECTWVDAAERRVFRRGILCARACPRSLRLDWCGHPPIVGVVQKGLRAHGRSCRAFGYGLLAILNRAAARKSWHAAGRAGKPRPSPAQSAQAEPRSGFSLRQTYRVRAIAAIMAIPVRRRTGERNGKFVPAVSG